MAFYVGIACIVALLAYIRLAPSETTRWHAEPEVSQDEVLPGGVKRIVQAGENTLAAFATIALQDTKTQQLAGSVESGMITFVSRSKAIGFPDYTTVHQVGDQLKIYGRLRFGRRDFGVNAARVDGWIDTLTTR